MDEQGDTQRGVEALASEDFGAGQLFWEIRNADDGVAETAHIVRWNPATVVLFGIPAAEAVGLPIRDLEVSGETPAAPGQERHWLVSYYPVHDQSGSPCGVGAVVVEITARQAMERMQQDFLAAVSHDLNNPLMMLRVQVQLVQRRAPREGSAAPAWLAEVTSRVEQHGGAIAAASEEGVGSTFTVRLPLAAGPVTPLAARA